MSNDQDQREAELTDFPVDMTVVDPFSLFDEEWPLLVCEKDGRVNAMTISWGSVGTLWNTPQATVFVRPSRFTFSLIQHGQRYSICWLGERYRDTLKYLGNVSGRDEDKIKEAGLTAVYSEDGTPYLAESDSVILCKKMFSQQMDLDRMEDQGQRGQHYEPDEPGHHLFIGEVTGVLAVP